MWRQLGLRAVVLVDPEANEQCDHTVGDEVVTDVSTFISRVDYVDACTPSPLTAAVVVAAATARRPTVCSWEFVKDISHAQAIAEMFAEQDVPLVPAGLRCKPAFAAAQKAVSLGNIGRPAVLRLAVRPTPATPPRPGSKPSIIAGAMVPALDYVRWIGGPIDTIYATATRQGPGFAVAILKHRRGAISQIEASWAQPNWGSRFTLEIGGSDGLITFRSDHAEPVNGHLHGFTGPTQAAGPPALESELRLVLAGLDGTAALISTPRDWVEAQRLGQAAGRSDAQQAPVRVEPTAGEAS